MKKKAKTKPVEDQGNVRRNISLTPATSKILDEVARHKDISVSAVLTCMIRERAEEMGILPAPRQISGLTAMPGDPKKGGGAMAG